MRTLTATRVLYGSLLLVAPENVLHALPHDQIDRRARTFARVLGARHLLQAFVVGRHGSQGWLRAGAAIDASHAATMIAIAVLAPRRRRLASANALAATTLAAAGIREAHRMDRHIA